MIKYFTLFLLTTMAWGNTSKKISGYDESNNSFFCKDTSHLNIPAFSFINSLKEVSNPKQIKNRKLRKCISKYSKACKKTNEMVLLYQRGSPHEDGRIIVEELSLINNVKYWYYVGGALSVIIFIPYLPVLIDFLDFFSDEEYEENNQYDIPEEEEHEQNLENYIKRKNIELGKKTFLPGLAIISIGYIGQRINIGQKKTFIKKSDTVHPLISKYFSTAQIKEAIRIYNNL